MAISTEFIANRVRLTRTSRDRRVVELAKKLDGVRSERAHLITSAGRPALNDRIETLAEKEKQLTRQLGQLTHAASQRRSWVSLKELRKAVPSGTVFLQIVKCPIWDVTKTPRDTTLKSRRYLAWAIPRENEGRVALIDLGDASTVDAAVGKCQAAVYGIRAIGTVNGMETAAKAAIRAAKELSRLVWDPMPDTVRRAKALIINPDGSLWLFPWESLPIQEKEFLVEQKQISYVVSGRDLVAKRKEASGRGAHFFVDPDFNMPPKPTAASSARVNPYFSRVSASGLLAGVFVRRLPSAGAESILYPPILERFTGSKPVVHSGRQATEEAFKTLNSSRMLVLSTHGFFLTNPFFDDMPMSEESQRRLTPSVRRQLARASPQERAALIAPLFRCGVALAGANRHDQTRDANDGILTGAEILTADLTGTELVILSACETGLGAVRSGEGVTGLRHAFLLAGARTVVASLWSVPDESTQRLMESFLLGLAAKRSAPEALRDAQIRLIRRLRTKYGAAHPGFWAGFTVTGKSG